MPSIYLKGFNHQIDIICHKKNGKHVNEMSELGFGEIRVLIVKILSFISLQAPDVNHVKVNLESQGKCEKE